jgi:hypothetical protein
MKQVDIVRHHGTVTRKRRETLNGHRGAVVWFTGLSGSRKSTVAHVMEERLHLMDCHTYVFYGDNVRHGLCAGLGFSSQDRWRTVVVLARWSSCSSTPASSHWQLSFLHLRGTGAPFAISSARRISLKSIADVPWKSASSGM